MKRFLMWLTDLILLAGALLVCWLIGGNALEQALSRELALYFFLCLTAGGAVFYVAARLVHELGHLALGKRAGFTLLRFALLGRVREYRDGKCVKKVRERFLLSSVDMVPKESPTPQDSGEGENPMPKGGNLRRRLMQYAAGGPLFSLCFLVVCTLLSVLSAAYFNIYVTAFLCPSFVCCFLPFKNAVIPDARRGSYSDGYVLLQLWRDTDFGRTLLALARISAGLWAGTTPAQLEPDLYFKVPVMADTETPVMQLNTYRLYFYLDKGDTDNAFNTAMRLTESVTAAVHPDAAMMPYFYVLLTVCMRRGGSIERKRAEGIAAICEKNLIPEAFAALALAYFYSAVKYDRAKRGAYLEKCRQSAPMLPPGIAALALRLADETPDAPLR